MVLECINKVWTLASCRNRQRQESEEKRAGKRLNLSDDEVELLGHMKDDPLKGTFWDNQNQVAGMTARD